jgi:hypothetical protein
MEHGGPASLLPPETLDRPIDLAALSFDTTEQLGRLHELVDQPNSWDHPLRHRDGRARIQR